MHSLLSTSSSSDAHLTTCGYGWPNFAAKNSDYQLILFYFDVVTHIFWGLLKSFTKIFSPLIEEIFLQNL